MERKIARPRRGARRKSVVSASEINGAESEFDQKWVMDELDVVPREPISKQVDAWTRPFLVACFVSCTAAALVSGLWYSGGTGVSNVWSGVGPLLGAVFGYYFREHGEGIG